MSRKVKWTAIGAILGIAYGYFSIEQLNAPLYIQISNNIGFLFGSMIGGMIWGIFLAVLVDYFSRKKNNT